MSQRRRGLVNYLLFGNKMFLQSLQSGKFVEYAFRKDLDFVSFKVPNRFTIISIQRRKERGCALAMLKCAL